jgi:pimeloyl-ACP methyl ester carboxylesterase
MTEQRLIVVPDGRNLEVQIAGPEGGGTLLFHDGTPGSGLPSPGMVAAVTERGFRYVSITRPGYAASTRRPGRTVADVAVDVVAVLDSLGVDRVIALGWSGGGPHCLASAALLPDRVAAAATVGCVAPFDVHDFDFLAGMGKENIEEFGAAVAGTAALVPYLAAWAPGLEVITAEEVADAMGDLIPPVDRSALTGEFAEFVATDFRHSLSQGIWGWHDDDLAFTRPWGFDLDAIAVPVTVWQGGQDRMVPAAHGAYLAEQIPGVRAHLLAEHGHLSLAVDSLGLIIDELIASAGPSA